MFNEGQVEKYRSFYAADQCCPHCSRLRTEGESPGSFNATGPSNRFTDPRTNSPSLVRASANRVANGRNPYGNPYEGSSHLPESMGFQYGYPFTNFEDHR